MSRYPFSWTGYWGGKAPRLRRDYAIPLQKCLEAKAPPEWVLRYFSKATAFL